MSRLYRIFSRPISVAMSEVFAGGKSGSEVRDKVVAPVTGLSFVSVVLMIIAQFNPELSEQIQAFLTPEVMAAIAALIAAFAGYFKSETVFTPNAAEKISNTSREA